MSFEQSDNDHFYSIDEDLEPEMQQTGPDALFDHQILPPEAYENVFVGEEAAVIPDAGLEAVRQPTRIMQMIGEVQSDTTLQQRHPTWPKVRLHFLFDTHESAGSYHNLPDLIRTAHVYCRESASGNAGTLFDQQLADGTLPENTRTIETFLDDYSVPDVSGQLKPLRGSGVENQYRALYRSGVVAGHFDLRPNENDEERELLAKTEELYNTPLQIRPQYEDFLQGIADRARETWDAQQKRDAIMVGPAPDQEQPGTAGRFEEEMARIFDAHPHLLEQEEVTVVATLGDAHITTFYRARAAGVTAERSFSTTPTIYGPIIQLERMQAIGKEPSAEFLSFIYVELQVRNALLASCGRERDDNEIVQLSRAIAGQFSYEDGQALYQSNRVPGSWPFHELGEALTRKGMSQWPRGIEAIRAANQQRADEYAAKVAAVRRRMQQQ